MDFYRWRLLSELPVVNNRAGDFLAALETVATSDGLWSATADYLDGLGFTHSIYSFVDVRDAKASRVWTSLPGSWTDRYMDESYQRVDPFYRYCCRTFAPICTGPEYLDTHGYLAEQERKVILEGGETGFRSGFSAPVRLIGGIKFGGWNFGSRFKRSELEASLKEHGDELRLAAFCIHEHAERLSQTESEPNFGRLSPRERECLLWLSRGLRTAAIADRLGIAQVTVDLHFRGARRKLGAATREEALAKAIAHGLFQL
jgi:DNA-binding CsgD family transcriptional regulator